MSDPIDSTNDYKCLATYIVIPAIVKALKAHPYIKQIFKDSVYGWDMRDENNAKILPFIAFYFVREEQKQYYGWNRGWIEARIKFQVTGNRTGVQQQQMITKDIVRFLLQSDFGWFNETFVDTERNYFYGIAETFEIQMISKYEMKITFDYFYDMFEYMFWVNSQPINLTGKTTLVQYGDEIEFDINEGDNQ